MKTRQLILLSLITALSLAFLYPVSAAGQPGTSIKELFEQAQQGWQEEIKGPRGLISVNIDIDVPQADAAPVLAIRRGNDQYEPVAHEGELLHLHSHVPPGVNPKSMEGTFSLYLNPPDGEYFIKNGQLGRNQPASWRNAFTRSVLWFRPLNLSRAYATNNPLTLGEAVDTVINRMKEATGGQVSLSLNVAETRGVYKTLEWSGQDPTLGELLAPEFYYLTFTQNLRGLPMLRGVNGDILHENAEGKMLPFSFVSRAQAGVGSAQSYSMGIRPVMETALLHEDIPLLPLTVIQDAIRSLVQSGHLRSVNSLRFGLVAYPNPNNPREALALPAWVVKGNYYRDAKAKDNPWNVFTPAGDGFIGGAENYLRDIIINAQTGQVLIDITNPKDQLAPEIQLWP